MDKVVVLGYGGHAKSVIDSIETTGKYEIIGYTDVEDKNAEGITYLGTDRKLEDIYNSGVRCAIFGVGYMGRSKIRDALYEKVNKIGFNLPCIIDPSAIIARDVLIGKGTFIGKRVVINAGASIGEMCILNTGCIVEHENVIAGFVHVAVGATLCGDVKVGSHSLIGANATIIQGVHIGSNVIIGAGSVVIKDIEDNKRVAGVPAKEI